MNEELKLTEMKSVLRSATEISVQKSRLGGTVAHLRLESGDEAYLKTSKGLERIENLRELRAFRNLKNILPVPELLGFQDDGLGMSILVKKVPGLPLHELIKTRSESNVLTILEDVFKKLWCIPASTSGLFPNAILEELKDISSLVESGLIDEKKFKRATQGRNPNDVFGEVKHVFSTRKADVFSHGDLCLPNILVDSSGRWTLIDLGKSGMADTFRDLSSIKGSLTRNLSSESFDELASRLGIYGPELDRNVKVYEELDKFWHCSIQE